MWVDNIMERIMFQTPQVTELTCFVDVAVDLETRVEVTSEIMLDSCSSRFRGDVEEITTTGI